MKEHHGFTLLEMAIVLVIVTLVAAAGLSLTTALRTNQGVATARTKQEAIKVALITFIARNQRLPCPAIETLAPDDDDYGVESGTPGTCGATSIPSAVLPGVGPIQRGVVPWVSLGLSDTDALDGWNNRFSYFVVEAATDNTPAAPFPLSGMRGGIALHSGTPVALGLPNQINACSTTAGDNGCNIAAVVLILSHGSNGSSAFMPSGGQLPPPVGTAALEIENTDADASFVQTKYSDNVINPFDDILLAVTPADLLGPLERNNSIQSALAITNDQITGLKDTLIASIVNSYGVGPSAPIPPPLPVPLPIDGWGTALFYAQGVPDVCGAPAGSTAFSITSRNIDLVASPDDIVYNQRNDQLKTIILAQPNPCP